MNSSYETRVKLQSKVIEMLNDSVNFDEEDIKDTSDNLMRLWENIYGPNPCTSEGVTMSVLSFLFSPKSKTHLIATYHLSIYYEIVGRCNST